MEGKGEAYLEIYRWGKRREGMERGPGNTGEGEEEAREERKANRAGKEKRK